MEKSYPSVSFINRLTNSRMKSKDFTMEFLVDQSPADVFSTIQNVKKWWSGFYQEQIEGSTTNINDEFTFRAAGGAHYSKQKLVEMIPGRKLVWLVTESKLTFIEDEGEWIGSKFGFEIIQQEKGTKIFFTHVGLVPEVECYEDCAMGWTQYLEALVSDMENKIVKKK